ncbi:MAG: mechanosensitive ion channel [Flavobacterium sp.]|uniref:mechanosensitive ion channel family protein n=1 Tax=Flavobacterium sp. TaxID=239 RepID=UPI0022C95CA9|nr:mechanosensitive ion channel domain-containing protein [Flavobacterium sp.]MCZ8197816.1 mechanosensitive ion channel [Flavobacterium sp.]
MELKNEISTFESYKDSFIKLLLDYSPKLLAAILLLIVGIWAIRIIVKVARKIMFKREIEPTLVEFLTDIIFWGLRVVLFIAVISKLGVESSSFVAILGAAGLAVGLSLQGSLSNFAGGMLIILFKPFKLGDVIEAQGVSGEVVDIQIFVTQLVTPNNQMIFVPNGALSNGTIINYSKLHNRRTDLNISLSYTTDIKKAKDIIETIFQSEPKILTEPKPTVIVKELTDQAIKIGIRAWSKNEDFPYVCSYILESAKADLDKAGIEIKPVIVETNKL